MIKIELTFGTVAEAFAALSKLHGETNVVKHDIPSGTVRPKAQQEAKPAPEPKAEPKAEAAPAEGPKVDYKQVQAAVMALTQIGANEPEPEKQVGRAAVKQVLKQLGLESFKGSPEGCWGTALELLQAKHAELTAGA